MDAFNEFLGNINGVIWADWVLYTVLGVGILFTLWSGFCQWRSLTHGVAVTTGRYDDPDDPGAINHFQALSAALSATVGLGNIAGVAIAIALVDLGKVLMRVALVGMALKSTRSVNHALQEHDDPNIHMAPPCSSWPRAYMGTRWFGTILGVIFCDLDLHHHWRKQLQGSVGDISGEAARPWTAG